jgi:hypothetical protein
MKLDGPNQLWVADITSERVYTPKKQASEDQDDHDDGGEPSRASAGHSNPKV